VDQIVAETITSMPQREHGDDAQHLPEEVAKAHLAPEQRLVLNGRPVDDLEMPCIEGILLAVCHVGRAPLDRQSHKLLARSCHCTSD
jgi:hypothetical protein